MKTTIDLAKRLFEIPTSPFHERHVLEEICLILKENKIPYFYDDAGNLIAGTASKKQIAKNSIAYIAHTDHPGFHFTLNSPAQKVKAQWMGGGPLTQMVGSEVLAHDYHNPSQKISGVITDFEPGNHHEGIEFEIKFKKLLMPGDYFGAFKFPGFILKKGKIVTKSADDLAGCVMALGALIDLKKNKSVKALGIFTRAEEVGFVGCWHMLEKKILPKTTKIISLEASRTLPGALLGEGPVVRLGDATTLFDSEFALFVTKVAQELKLKDPSFKFQKRVMDGGSCEATAVSLFGYTTMGLAVPLDNYHNMGAKGAAPEIIHALDMENGRKLLTQVGLNLKNFSHATQDLKKKLRENFKNMGAYLTSIEVL
jgi:endoglucanase